MLLKESSFQAAWHVLEIDPVNSDALLICATAVAEDSRNPATDNLAACWAKLSYSLSANKGESAVEVGEFLMKIGGPPASALTTAPLRRDKRK